SGVRYLSHTAGGSTTWESLSNTGKRLATMLSPRDRGIGGERGLDFVLGGPPVRTFDLSAPFADEMPRGRDVIQPSRVGAEELGLISDRKVVFLHRLHGPPGVVAIMVIDVRR